MKDEKFKVIEFIRNIIIDIDKELKNFPKADIELKNRIRTNCYDMLELAYEANTCPNLALKKELVNKVLAKVKIVDFLINLSSDKALISNKKYIKLGLRLDDIAKYTAGWIKSIGSS